MGAHGREALDEGLAAATCPIIRKRFRLALEAKGAVAGGEAAAFAVVRAVRKEGIRRVLGAPPLPSDDALREAGGLTQYDLLEVEILGAKGARLGADTVPPCALEYFASYR